MIPKVKTVYAFVALFYLCTSAYSQDEIKLSGYGATGFKAYDRNVLRKYNQEVYYEGKIQIDFKYNNKLEAQIDLRGESEDQKVILREFSVKYKASSFVNFKAGNIKKPFGREQLVDREELTSVDRSYIANSITDFGFGGRAVGISIYNNFNPEKDSLPISYNFMFFKDNSLHSGIASRISLHSDKLAYSVNYLLLDIGGEIDITAHGFSADANYSDEFLSSSIELYYVQDPIESVRRRDMGTPKNIFILGAKADASFYFKTDGEFFKAFEPMILGGVFFPDNSEIKYHTLEMLIGLNAYLSKKVRLRLNGDLLLTKDLYNTSYQTINSKIALEIQARF